MRLELLKLPLLTGARTHTLRKRVQVVLQLSEHPGQVPPVLHDMLGEDVLLTIDPQELKSFLGRVKDVNEVAKLVS